MRKSIPTENSVSDRAKPLFDRVTQQDCDIGLRDVFFFLSFFIHFFFSFSFCLSLFFFGHLKCLEVCCIHTNVQCAVEYIWTRGHIISPWEREGPVDLSRERERERGFHSDRTTGNPTGSDLRVNEEEKSEKEKPIQ